MLVFLLYLVLFWVGALPAVVVDGLEGLLLGALAGLVNPDLFGPIGFYPNEVEPYG